jgi:ATP/maltotriose-dependent transcriptional regulator MalT
MSPEMILCTKLFSPPPHRNLVAHPRLLSKLAAALCPETRLTLIYAPAGFGKTSLVVDWLKQIDLPGAWLSLDKAGNDLPRFLAYLAAAFQQVDEEIGAPLLNAVQSPQLPAIKTGNTNASHN